MKRYFFKALQLLLVVVLIHLNKPVMAQQDSLFISNIILPDTIYEGISYDSLVLVSIQNSALNTTFVGNIIVLMAQDSLGSIVDTLISSSQQTLQPGAILTLSPNGHFFDPLFYKAGGNTVVVWPVSLFAAAADSFHTGFFYIKSSEVHETDGSGFDFILKPNPVFDRIFITSEKWPELVRIFASDGRLVYSKPVYAPFIETEILSPGLYLLECRYKNKKSIYKKFLKL